MPKFLYSVVFLSLVLLSGVVLFLLKITPSSNIVIVSFLVFLFITLFFSLSIPLYFLKRKVKYLTQREIYRSNLGWSLILSLGITGVLFLRAFDLFTKIGIGILLVVLVFISLKIRNREKKEIQEEDKF